MEKSFPDYYEYYESVCRNNIHLSGQNMQVRFKGFATLSRVVRHTSVVGV